MSERPEQLRPGIRRLLWTCVLLFALLGAWNSLGRVATFIDDAYISLRYAWNLAFHGELSFNLGEHVEGYSNPTWTVALALPLWLGLPGREAAQALGLLCQIGTIGASVWLASELVRPRTLAGALVTGLAGALSAISLPLAFWATAGLETPMVTLFLTAGLAAGLAERRDPARRPLSAFLVGLFAISRPETPLLALGVVLGRALSGVQTRQWRDAARWAAVFAVPTVGYLLFRVAWFRDVLPNTYYVKGGAASLDEVRRYVLPWAELEPLLAAGGLAGLLALAWTRRLAVLPLLWAAGAGAFFVARVGGDYMPNARYLAPVLPLLAVGAAAGAGLLIERLEGRLRVVVAVACLAMVGAQGLASVDASIASLGDDGALKVEARTERERLPGALTASPLPGGVTMYLLQNVPPGAKLAHSTLGASGYLGDWVMLDLMGLTNREISGATGLDLKGQLEYIRDQDVDWILLRPLNIGRFKKLRAERWLRRYDLTDLGGGVIAGRRKTTPKITDEQILTNLSTACARLPRSRQVCKGWADWALAVGGVAEATRACDSLANTGTPERNITACHERIGMENPRPDAEGARLTRADLSDLSNN